MRDIKPSEIRENPFKLIGDDWMLVTAAKDDGSFNTMTASWGGVGVLWNRPVCFVFIRPQRYTHEFTEQAKEFTLSFYPDTMRDALTLCGRKSGRDCDKVKEAKLKALTIGKDGKAVYFAGAKLVMKVKKLYRSEIDKDCFTDPSIPEKMYPGSDYHSVYICEIERVLAE